MGGGLIVLGEAYKAPGGGGRLSQVVVYCSCLAERVRFHPAGPEGPCQIGFQEQQPSPRSSAVHFWDDNLPCGLSSFSLPTQPLATWG